MMKLFLNSRQIFKDIGVIKLEIIYHQSIAVVVNKLGTLIKKGTVILVRLYNKITASRTITKPRRETEVTGHTAN